MNAAKVALAANGESVRIGKEQEEGEMATMAYGKWHAWQGTQFMLSDENTKTLRAFPNKDAAINWLWVNGEKDAARVLNKTRLYC